jgi:hypothetical protein
VIRVFYLAVLLGFGCVPKPQPVNPVPKPDPYAPDATDVCERFCAILDRGNCAGEDGSPGEDEVRGNADDVPCTRVCSDVLSKGTYSADEACLNVAASCEAAEECVFQ